MKQVHGPILLLLLLLSSCAGPAPEPGQEPAPQEPAPLQPQEPEEPTGRVLIDLTEYNPWAEVVGGDAPRVLLLDDGTLIYARRKKGERDVIVTAKLDAGELAAVRARIGPTAEFLALKDDYDLRPNVTDQRVVVIELATRGQDVKSVGVRGFIPKEFIQLGETHSAGPDNADTLPAEFARVYEALLALDPPDGTPWSPEWVEILLWPFDYSAEVPLDWPADLPGLDHPLSYLRREDSWSLFAPGTRLEELRKMDQSLGNRKAVLVGGKKWSVAVLPVYPKGKAWEHLQEKLKK